MPVLVAGVIATVAIALPAAASFEARSNIVEAIAQRFGLNTTEVQEVFDEQRAEMQANMQERCSQKLDQLVIDGNLNQEQADKILEKKSEMQAEKQGAMDSFQEMTREERKAAMQEKKASLEQWAQENDIPLEYLMPKGPKHRGRIK